MAFSFGSSGTKNYRQCHRATPTKLLLYSTRKQSALAAAAAAAAAVASTSDHHQNDESDPPLPPRHVVIIGAGWGGLGTAHALIRSTRNTNKNQSLQVTVIEASPTVGGLVRDGFTTLNNTFPAEAGQHGFWNNYNNIYQLLRREITTTTTDNNNNDNVRFDIHQALTTYAEQGQYNPQGLQAIWPVYRNQPFQLPTGLAQAVYTRFLNLPWTDKLSALPLVAAFSEFDDSVEAWDKYDKVSFRDLCIRLGVSQRCYTEAFEPMILTGLFAPGAQCSAAAALGMGKGEREKRMPVREYGTILVHTRNLTCIVCHKCFFFLLVVVVHSL
jgi:uncharacterized protein with NAD-binding domain and iron-sulfur cluster